MGSLIEELRRREAAARRVRDSQIPSTCFSPSASTPIAMQRFMIVLSPKNLGIPAREPITLSNSLTRLRKYPPMECR
jgi:hypothetical protein